MQLLEARLPMIRRGMHMVMGFAEVSDMYAQSTTRSRILGIQGPRK